jgi:uncharacterized iron-regulated protein
LNFARLRTELTRAISPALAFALIAIAPPPTAATDVISATPEALASIMSTRRNVLLGETHDNALQHALRAAALRQIVEAGARPALAFEQFDRDRQADIDRARREQPGDIDALVELGTRGWQWSYYRPYLRLAVEYGLPIVASNLSRADAAKVASQGWDAVFDPAGQAELDLDRLPPGFVAAHQQAVAQGHCNLLPADALPRLAKAQIARDIVLARSLRPHLRHGVVLLAGNGHVRKDIGVPYWLSEDERRDVLSIGLLEIDPDGTRGAVDELAGHYDALMETPAADRPDPCEALRNRLQPAVKH